MATNKILTPQPLHSVLKTSLVNQIPISTFLKQFTQHAIEKNQCKVWWEGKIFCVECPGDHEYTGRWKFNDNGIIRIGDLIAKTEK
jgi:hypothetical protein